MTICYYAYKKGFYKLKFCIHFSFLVFKWDLIIGGTVYQLSKM